MEVHEESRIYTRSGSYTAPIYNSYQLFSQFIQQSHQYFISSVFSFCLFFTLKTFALMNGLEQPLDLFILFLPGSIGLSCPCWPVKHFGSSEEVQVPSPHYELNMWPIWSVWLPANLLQLKTLLSLITGTEAKEATNQFDRGWFSDLLQVLDCGIQDRRSLLVRPCWRYSVPTLKEWEIHPPSAGGSEKVRLNWKDNCWRVIRRSPSGETTLTMPSPAFMLYFSLPCRTGRLCT